MLIEHNTLKRIDPDDIIDGVFTAPDEVLYVGNDILCECDNIKEIVFPNVIEIGYAFLYLNKTIIKLYMPKVERIGYAFLYTNKVVESIYMPNIKEIGFNFLVYNDSLENLDIPNIECISSSFLACNTKFRYTSRIIKALEGDLYIDGRGVNKLEYLRNINIRKILC